MNTKGTRKIGQKIVALVVLAIVLAVFTLSGSFLYLQVKQGLDAKRQSIEATSYVFAAAIADPVATGDRQTILQTLRSIRRVPGVRFASVRDRNGNELASLGTASMLGNDTVQAQSNWLALLTRGWFLVATDIIKGGEPVGRLVIYSNIGGLREQLAWTVFLTIMSAIASAGFAVLAALRLQGRITQPIVALTRAMTKVREARDYSASVEHEADDETGHLVEAFNGMISEINYRDTALKQLAYIDPLTGLGNRRTFSERLDAVIASARSDGPPAALVFLDLDRFKSVNDTYGHTVGDSLLMDVAARFAACDPKHFVVRLGGDEFAVIIEGAGTEDAVHVAIAPYMASLYGIIEIAGRHIQTGLSAGAALVPRDGDLAADIMRRADLALHEAKRRGRSRLEMFRPPLEDEVRTRTELALELATALHAGQFEVHYQPQVSLAGDRVSFEALARWKHPRRGYVSPAIFVPLAESEGLIVRLGGVILRESCRQMQAWCQAKETVGTISVNVSIAQLNDPDFPESVQRTLFETGLPAQRLCLEVTESLFAGTNLGAIREALLKLKAFGVSLAIDDFGTGYSSLSYLHGFPFDKLKIDRAFVRDVHLDTSRQRLLRGIVELSHALGLSVVAEGAESQAEVNILQALAVDTVQGYVFGKPQPADLAIATARRLAGNTARKTG